MRAMRSEGFSGYKDLKLVDIPKPALSDGRVLVRITGAGVTPLDYTILSGGHPRAKAPLALGGEGAAVVEEGGGTAFPVGSRVITEGYGADIVIDAIGGETLSEALGTLATSGSLTTLGYAAGRKSTIDLETRKYEELLPFLAACGRMEHCMERYFCVTSIQCG
jgi:NADPH:quinone reductase-like Zn-dependent oxidoreductase